MRRLLVLVLTAGAVGAATGGVQAAFFATTANPAGTFSSQRIFSGERTTAAWILTDSATLTPVNRTHDISFADGTFFTTGNWANTWSTSRYLEFDLSSPLPAGIGVTGAEFSFTFADNDTSAGNQWCFYFDVRRRSDGAVLSTHGSSLSPAGCEAVGALTTVTTALPAVTTSNLANDLTIRVYGRHSQNNRAARVDRATISASAYSAVTLYPNFMVHAATSSPSTLHWGPAKVDGNAYVSNSFSPLYVPGRYLEFTFPAYLPPAATVTAASFVFTYRSNTAATACYYFEVYAGATLLATHGGVLADVDCNGNASFRSISTPVPSVNTAARANSVVVRVYAKHAGSAAVQVDGAHLALTYSLDAAAGS